MSAPQGVRLVLPDGTEFPLELTHRGLDTNGIDIWQATVPVSLSGLLAGAEVRAAVLPARTGIAVGLAE